MSEFGKFGSAEELLKGYTELEKSYTRKCQQLSELQKQYQNELQPQSAEQNQNDALEKDGTSGQPDQRPSPSETADETQSVANDKTVPPAQRADSAEQSPSVASPPPKVMTAGGNASMALPNRPRTLSEASELAKKYFE